MDTAVVELDANIAKLKCFANSLAIFSGAYYSGMNRRDLLRALIESRFGGNQADFARAIKKSPAQVHQWLSGYRALGDAGARNIELALKLGVGYFDGRPEEHPVDLSTDDKQTLELSQYLPPEKLAELIERVRQERDEKAALLAALLDEQRHGEAVEPPPAPPKEPEPQPPHSGKPYKLPEPGVARLHAGAHKKRIA